MALWTQMLARLMSRLICVIAALVACPLADAARAQTQTAQTEPQRRPLIFVPGILGSRLCRPNPDNPAEPIVVWGTLGALPSFSALRLSADGSRDDIKPCGLVREVVYLGLFTQDIYAPILAHLSQSGYRENRDLFVFDYDWRRSVFDNAESLAAFIREKIPDSNQEIDILAHSLGGLIARVYAIRNGGADRIAHLVSAATPFLGSVRVYETLDRGWGALSVAMGGIHAFRRTILSFPSIFELMPRYAACCDVDEGQPLFRPSTNDAWRALGWEGVDPKFMPNLEIVFARVRALQEIVEAPLPDRISEIALVGVDQRTSHRVMFQKRRHSIAVRVQTTWQGDGKVIRESAAIPRANIHPTRFADHDRILSDPQIQQFVSMALRSGVGPAMASLVPRPRDMIRMADQSRTELVGVAIEPDEPMYQVGDACKVHVHLRLGDQVAMPLSMVRLVHRDPDGIETAIALSRDPSASDPTNPFEQSFVGAFAAGTRPGLNVLRAEITIDGGPPRLAERSLVVLAP